MKSMLSSSMPVSGKLKVFLLVFAFLIVGGTLFYTHEIVQQLQAKEREVANLYAKSLGFIANAKEGEGDYSFVFNEIILAIDFPIIETDASNQEVKAYRNLALDSSKFSRDGLRKYFLEKIAEMDEIHPPVKVAFQDTIILSFVHYGESPLITKLRWLPFVELSIVALFILIGYISFSYVKRSEQSNIWVGMARETAHQLGTPISSMMGWVELLKEQMGDDSKEMETINDMQNDVLRLQKIADRFSKIGSKPDLHEENLQEVIDKVIQYFDRRIPHTGKKVAISIENKSPASAKINRELFEWVIENLTKNALDAIENGVGRISFSIFERGNVVFIDVADTGKGIDLKHRNEVFRPGFSTKKRGWGLGLSLSKRIIETYHSGKLFVKESRPGFGTTFRIKLKK
ncbi:MAG TPA: HAMP domain-containing sensor histidine kinase [Bacteroidota bacterium]|nr:HAMP domain-containing sensor histidine kinase [Bacteroidota bacterium]